MSSPSTPIRAAKKVKARFSKAAGTIMRCPFAMAQFGIGTLARMPSLRNAGAAAYQAANRGVTFSHKVRLGAHGAKIGFDHKYIIPKGPLRSLGRHAEKAAKLGQGLAVLSAGVAAVQEGRRNWHLTQSGSHADKAKWAAMVGYAGGREAIGYFGGKVGAKGGAVAGAKVGAVVGSVFPGVGTAIGAAIGAAAGGAIGYYIGKRASKAGLDAVAAPGNPSAQQRRDRSRQKWTSRGQRLGTWLRGK